MGQDNNRIMEAKIFPNEKSPRLFKSKTLEFLTKSHPMIIFLMYSALAVFLVYFFMSHYGGSATTAITLFIVGLFSWTLGEYLMHRFLYHKIKDASYAEGFQYMFHGIHHEYPNDSSRIVLPPLPSIVIAALFFGVFFVFMGKYAFVVGPGFVIGYSMYMWIHHTIHNKPSPKKYNFWWRHHNIHHFQQHDRAFGVSTSLWDRVFFTMPEKNRKTVVIDSNHDDDHKHPH